MVFRLIMNNGNKYDVVTRFDKIEDLIYNLSLCYSMPQHNISMLELTDDCKKSTHKSYIIINFKDVSEVLIDDC